MDRSYLLQFDDLPRSKPQHTAKKYRGMTYRERFYSRLALDPETGCMNWTSTIQPGGYGVTCLPHSGPSVNAHRVAYEMANGAVPDGLQIDHLCRNRRCCNPAHLEAVTPRENVLRGTSFAAKFGNATHCVNGHPFDEKNTNYRPSGGRKCRACAAAERRRKVAAMTPEERDERNRERRAQCAAEKAANGRKYFPRPSRRRPHQPSP